MHTNYVDACYVDACHGDACHGGACTLYQQSRYEEYRLLRPAEWLRLLHKLWEIALSIHSRLSETKLSVRSVCFHLIQSVIDADRIMAEKIESSDHILEGEQQLHERQLIIAQSLSDILETAQQDLSNNSPNGLDALVAYSTKIVDQLLASELVHPISGLISIAAETHSLPSAEFLEKPLRYAAYLALLTARARPVLDQHLGQALEALQLLVNLKIDWDISQVAWIVRAIGIDHTGYGNDHNNLLKQILPIVSAFAREKLVKSCPCSQGQVVALVQILFETANYLRQRVELVPIITVLLKNQAVLREVIESPSRFSEFSAVKGVNDAQFNYWNFLARCLVVYSWAAEFNPCERIRMLQPLADRQAQQTTPAPTWAQIDVSTYCLLLNLTLGAEPLTLAEQEVVGQTLPNEAQYLIGIALNSIFRGGLRHKSVREKIPNCSAQIAKWLRNGILLLEYKAEFGDNLDTAHTWRLTSLIAALKTILLDQFNQVTIALGENERSNALLTLLVFEQRLILVARESFESAITDFKKQAETLSKSDKLKLRKWYHVSTPRLQGLSLAEVLAQHSAAITAISLFRKLSLEDPDTTLRASWHRTSFDSQRFFRKVQRTTADCASLCLALIRCENQIEALHCFQTLISLVYLPGNFKEYFPIWNTFFCEQRVPFLREVLHVLAILEPWIAEQLNSRSNEETLHLRKLLHKLGISVDAAQKTSRHVLLQLLPRDLREKIVNTYNQEYNQLSKSEPTKRDRDNLRNVKPLNFFEVAIKTHLAELLKQILNDETNSLAAYQLEANCYFMLYEIDLLITANFKDDSQRLIIVRCNGEAWHRFFGEVLSDTDRIKNQVLANAAYYLPIGSTTIKIIEVRQADYQSRDNESQRSYLQDLLEKALFMS